MVRALETTRGWDGAQDVLVCVMSSVLIQQVPFTSLCQPLSEATSEDITNFFMDKVEGICPIALGPERERRSLSGTLDILFLGIARVWFKCTFKHSHALNYSRKLLNVYKAGKDHSSPLSLSSLAARFCFPFKSDLRRICHIFWVFFLA